MTEPSKLDHKKTKMSALFNTIGIKTTFCMFIVAKTLPVKYDKKGQSSALFMQAQLGLGGGFTSLIIIWMCSFVGPIQLHCCQHIKNRTAFVAFPL